MRRTLIVILSVIALLATGTPVANAHPSGHYFEIGVIYFNSPGKDTGTNDSLNAEYITIKNITKVPRYLTGWSFHDRQGHKYKFGTVIVKVGGHVTVRTGMGTNTPTTGYWGQAQYVWNNDSDGATLNGPKGTRQDNCTYTAADDPEKVC